MAQKYSDMLASGGVEIGQIVQAYADLGDDFLPCLGQTLARANYSALSSRFPGNDYVQMPFPFDYDNTGGLERIDVFYVDEFGNYLFGGKRLDRGVWERFPYIEGGSYGAGSNRTRLPPQTQQEFGGWANRRINFVHVWPDGKAIASIGRGATNSGNSDILPVLHRASGTSDFIFPHTLDDHRYDRTQTVYWIGAGPNGDVWLVCRFYDTNDSNTAKNALYTSADKGATFTRRIKDVSNDIRNANQVVPLDSNTAYFEHGGSLKKTDDRFSTETVLFDPNDYPEQINKYIISRNATHIIAYGSVAGYVSTDGGQTWAKMKEWPYGPVVNEITRDYDSGGIGYGVLAETRYSPVSGYIDENTGEIVMGLSGQNHEALGLYSSDLGQSWYITKERRGVRSNNSVRSVTIHDGEIIYLIDYRNSNNDYKSRIVRSIVSSHDSATEIKLPNLGREYKIKVK